MHPDVSVNLTIDCPPTGSTYELEHRSNCGPCRMTEAFESRVILRAGSMNDMTDVELEEYRELKSATNRAHDPFIHRLPPEIGAYIFWLCVPKYSDGQYAMPWVLGMICKYWRHIAWTTPQLWTELCICVKSVHSPESCDIIQAALLRSRSLPLSISVSVHLFRDDISPTTFSTLIEMMNQCSDRWQTISLNVPKWVLALISPRNGDTTLLKDLHLRSNYDIQRRWNSHGVTCRMESASPSCLSFNIGGCPLNLLEIGWGRMTTLEVQEIKDDECLELLRRCPLLSTFKFYLSWRSGDAQFHFYPVTHYQLKTIELETDCTHVPLNLFDALTLPALQKFSYGDWELGGFHWDMLLSLFRRSGCMLKDLRVGLVEDDWDDSFIRLLKNITSLRTLMFELGSDSNRTLYDILYRVSRRNFLPELVSLECTCRRPLAWKQITDSIGGLENLRTSLRWPHKVQININLGSYSEDGIRLGYMSAPVIRRIHDILEAGFDFNIAYVDPDEDSKGATDIFQFVKKSLDYNSNFYSH
ncbi:hypothetical protein CPB84DRAFT_1963850 [Gymnopilus junonius]|uniref:F-box domain-containing protein n=1 Tax=Gymnopilus junonius TaxID=109634 RepID=A0A9P5NKC3_GYMJU|nr:hypothetical protein CPB84DRAFT_1963850 [Gymnopilus junonius]